MGDGIAADMIRLFEAFLIRFLGAGRTGPDAHFVTNGAAGFAFPILRDTNYIVPAFTLVNNGTSSVTFGPNGNASHPLPAGSSFTYRWKNPAKLNLVINDGGTAATIDVV